MNETESPNFSEYIYEKKNVGKTRLKRSLMISLYVIFFIAFFIFCYITRIIPLFAVAPLLLYILVLLTWRLVKYDIFWQFSKGKLDIGKIKTSRFGTRRKTVTSIHIKDAQLITVYEGAHQYRGIKRVYDFSESKSSDNRIIIIYIEEGRTCCAIIEATARLAKILSAFSDKCENIKGQVFHG